ncbi:MAG: hypothetical protein MI892_15705 [Desulfobacterales bacterium]|nr:hypothetical protein [Desulfobacterales bacterium]
MERADATPFVIGKKGSALDLLMNTLYFGDEVPELTTMEAFEKVQGSGLAWPIPLYVRFKTLQYPIVGTGFEYFEFRKLEIKEGRQIAVLGECVIGSRVAKEQNLKPGDHLLTSPENLFDLAGTYPLKMKVTGVLAPAYSADDLAVFTDIKTCWVIQGLGHGHQDVTQIKDPTLVLKREPGNVAASPKLFHYNEITKENRDSFHFHGNTYRYPVSAVIALPESKKAGTILQGRFLSDDTPLQIAVPSIVISGLMDNIFKMKNVLSGLIYLVAFAMILSLFLVFSLSMRLREKELVTVFKLGCSRQTIASLIMAEILIILTVSVFLCVMMALFMDGIVQDLVRLLFIK